MLLLSHLFSFQVTATWSNKSPSLPENSPLAVYLKLLSQAMLGVGMKCCICAPAEPVRILISIRPTSGFCSYVYNIALECFQRGLHFDLCFVPRKLKLLSVFRRICA